MYDVLEGGNVVHAPVEARVMDSCDNTRDKGPGEELRKKVDSGAFLHLALDRRRIDSSAQLKLTVYQVKYVLSQAGSVNLVQVAIQAVVAYVRKHLTVVVAVLLEAA